jgi:hypothetical protein
MDKSEKVRQLIVDFENGKISSDSALSEINELANVDLDLSWLYSYNSSIDLEMFVRILTIEPIVDWKEIDDKRAIEIINEALGSIGDDAILQRNFEALEKKYSKPTGALSGWIFQNDIMDSNELLQLLKKNTSIAL